MTNMNLHNLCIIIGVVGIFVFNMGMGLKTTLGPAQLKILNAELLIQDKQILAIFQCNQL